MAVTAASSTAAVESQSPHLSDSSTLPFLRPDFDPADHLNSLLPALSLSSTARTTPASQHGRAVPLPELSSQLQTLLSQLNAQATRLANALTQLTDEILRSGGRLAYEVEVLRGETLGLTDSLENGLREDIERFVPPGRLEPDGSVVDPSDPAELDPNLPDSVEPDALERLRSLTKIRARLDAVIKVFGEAMEWPIAPSELSAASSLISISAPDAGQGGHGREEAGKAYAEKLRNEIDDLVSTSQDFSGIEAAEERITQLRRLTEVWKGTAEEKARLKFVDGLSKLVEERQRSLAKGSARRKPAPSPSRVADMRYGDNDTAQGSYGFLQNLRSLRNDVYLE